MDTLRFAHHFFHFETAAWGRLRALDLPDDELLKNLFAGTALPRRELRRHSKLTYRDALEAHKEELSREKELGIRAIPEDSCEYPEALRQLPPERRPALVYLRGAPVPPENHLAAVVGTRRPSDFGRDAAESFAAYLTAVGVRIVSGLARGIDTLAHERALELGTIAVLGGGVGDVYPAENQELAERILARGGTLLSPFPLDQVPLPQNFPDRNELIAALSTGVIVIEGAEKSGASITGRHALAMGKGVVALTQDFRSEYGRGAIRLAQDGAVLVTREEEAIEALWRRFGGFAGALPSSERVPKHRTFTFREFHAATARSVPEAVALLEEGILQGKIQRVGARYRLTSGN
jgi:DNA protecting protein DprA